MIGIYKITNSLNNKVYIGQSINIERRWKDHRSVSSWRDYPLYRSFQKYGLKSFSFEVLEECSFKNLNYLEEHYIALFKSQDPNFGYNISKGGNSNASLGQEVKYSEVRDLLKTTKLSQEAIGEMVNLSQRMVSYINLGEIGLSTNEEYPIREQNILKQETLCEACGSKISRGARLCDSCYRLSSRKVERPSPERLREELVQTNFTQVGKRYGVSCNAIRRWCRSYGMSTKSKDYK